MSWIKRHYRLFGGIFLAAIFLSACIYYFFFRNPDQFATFGSVFIPLLLFAILFSFVFWHKGESWQRFLLILALILMLVGAVFSIGEYLVNVTDYPFPLGWSEGNRLYDYSMMFGHDRYRSADGEQLFTFVTWGRQFIYGLIFVLPNIGIAGVRLWQVVCWVGLPLLLGGILASYIAPAEKRFLWGLIFAAWTFLFINQGPVYVPLLLSAILVVLAVKAKPLILSIVLVAIATWYADGSRWTWAYAPGLWAALLVFVDLENPKLLLKNWKEFIRPVTLGLTGLATIVITKWVFPHASLIESINQMAGVADKVNNISGASQPIWERIVNAVNSQPMIFSRLLPAKVYPPGIFLGSVWVALPVLLLMVYWVAANKWKLNWLQRIISLLVVGAFWGAGLVVSTKIGGGSNLHNLDMLWCTLLLLLAWAIKAVQPKCTQVHENGVHLILVVIVLFSPMSYAIFQRPGVLQLPDQELLDEALQQTQVEVDAVLASGKDVLFIDHRQLLTFGYLQDVPLVDDYEKKVLMEMALQDNGAYFNTFYWDLYQKKYPLIISEPINLYIQIDSSFDMENNTWIHWVSEPLLCFYEPLITYPELKLQLLVPRTTPLTQEELETICPFDPHQ